MNSEERRVLGLDRASRIARRGKGHCVIGSSHRRPPRTKSPRRLPKLDMLLAREKTKKKQMIQPQEESSTYATSTTSSFVSSEETSPVILTNINKALNRGRSSGLRKKDSELRSSSSWHTRSLVTTDHFMGAERRSLHGREFDEQSKASVQSVPIDVDSLQEFEANDPSYASYVTAPFPRHFSRPFRPTRRQRKPAPVDLDTGLEIATIDESDDWERQLAGYMPGFEIPREDDTLELVKVIEHGDDKYEV